MKDLSGLLAVLAIFLFTTISYGQATNLLDLSTWVAGNGELSNFPRNGNESENEREIGVDPFGNSSLIWKATPDAQSDADGGWNSSAIAIDHTKSYRFTVWMKKTNSQEGYTLFGPKTYNNSNVSTTLELDGTANGNPYFLAFTDLPDIDQWYLLVGYVHASDYGGQANIGAVYDASGTLITSLNDFKFSTTSTTVKHRAYLYYDINTADRQYFFEPTIYEVNDQMPSISEMINAGDSGGGDTSGGISTQNVALNSLLTSQSSLYGTATQSGAANAVDGNTDGIRNNNSTTHTQPGLDYPWWRVELEAETSIGEIKVFNRNDTQSNANRLIGAKVYVGNLDSSSPNDYTEVGTLTGSPDVQVVPNVNVSGKYVMIYIPQENAILNIAEVEVYANIDNTGGGDPETTGGHWTKTGSNIHYTTGNVGIGTTAQSAYRLAVDGTIHTKEVRVDETGWADYVFFKDYKLPTLQEVEQHIQDKGHLINMPSAAEVEANGIELGEMNKLLLEKIEELTLYIIQQEKRITSLEEKK